MGFDIMGAFNSEVGDPNAEFGSFDRGVLRMVDPDAVADNYPPRKWARR